MNRSFCAAMIVFLSVFNLGCETENAKLSHEVEELRAEVQRLKSMRTDIKFLEDELKLVRGRLQHPVSPEKAAPAENSPVASQEYTPDGSQADDPFLGPADGTILMMAFTDIQCKPCRQFATHTLPLLTDEFFKTNKVKFILRDFPLRSNPGSDLLAQALQCAGEQGFYWELFAALNAEPVPIPQKRLPKLLAAIPELDVTRSVRCLESSKYAREVQQDAEQARALGAKGTPSVFIGKKGEDENYRGVFVRGGQPLEVFRNILLRELEG